MANPGEPDTEVACKKDKLNLDLSDGRFVSEPLACYPRLLHATSRERDNCEIAAAGFGIHWSDLDEVLSVEVLLRGAPSPLVKKLNS